MKRIGLTYLILLLGVAAMASPDTLDTPGVAKKKSSFRATARIHSMGLFSYGGRLVCQNHVIDIQLVYNRQTWGFQFFKAMDLSDRQTPINFALAAVNRSFMIGKKLTVTPHVGVMLEQFSSLADHGSDAVVILITAYRIHPNFTLEHSALVGNLVIEPDMRDWVNRLRLLYSKGNLDVTLFAWHNNRVFDTQEYATVGLSVLMNRLPLTGRFKLQCGLTGLYMTGASDERTRAGANGLFMTLGVSVN